MNPDCVRTTIYSRGICYRCYSYLHRKIKAKLLTWEELEAKGKVLASSIKDDPTEKWAIDDRKGETDGVKYCRSGFHDYVANPNTPAGSKGFCTKCTNKINKLLDLVPNPYTFATKQISYGFKMSEADLEACRIEEEAENQNKSTPVSDDTP